MSQEKEHRLDLAAAQFIGYKIGKWGSISQLIESMALTKEEWDIIKRDYDPQLDELDEKTIALLFELENLTGKKTKKRSPLTKMQDFFLNTLYKSPNEEFNPGYLANLYYESIGKRRSAASRDSFGQTSAAYRTCRKLAEFGLIEQVKHKTKSGYSYTTYTTLKSPKLQK